MIFPEESRYYLVFFMVSVIEVAINAIIIFKKWISDDLRLSSCIHCVVFYGTRMIWSHVTNNWLWPFFDVQISFLVFNKERFQNVMLVYFSHAVFRNFVNYFQNSRHCVFWQCIFAECSQLG